MTGILLSGGQSKRMGEDKAFLSFRGKPLFLFAWEVLNLFCEEVLISSSNPRYQEMGYHTVQDTIKNIGPLGGIYSGLKAARYKSCAVLSCDMPFLPAEYFRYLHKHSGKADVIIGSDRLNHPEPLAGIYSQQIILQAEKQISQGNYKMIEFIKQTNSLILSPPEDLFDLDKIYTNINSKKDLEKIKKHN